MMVVLSLSISGRCDYVWPAGSREVGYPPLGGGVPFQNISNHSRVHKVKPLCRLGKDCIRVATRRYGRQQAFRGNGHVPRALQRH